MSRQRWIEPPLIVVGLLVGVGGCSDSPPPAFADAAPLEPSPHIEGAYELPLEPFLFRDEYTERTIFKALELAAQECMEERGFEYRPANFRPDRPADIYGLLGVDRAREFGYRPPVTELSDAAEQPLSEEASIALIGDRTDYVTARTSDGRAVTQYAPDSCSGNVTDRLRPDWPDLLDAQAKLQAISDEALRILYEVDTPSQAWAAWSVCMADAGYQFEHPWAPYESLWAGSEPRDVEIDTAVADARWKETTDVLTGWSASLARVQRELLEQNPGVLAQWLGLREEHLDVAEQYLAEEGD